MRILFVVVLCLPQCLPSFSRKQTNKRLKSESQIVKSDTSLFHLKENVGPTHQ